MNKQALVVVICLAGIINFTSAENIRGIDIEFVNIGHPGNPADANGTMGCGAVAYEYRIGKYEITNEQWDSFVAIAGAPMGSDGGYNNNAYWIGSQQPTNCISWYEAAQFCNYLTSGDKSKGAYQFSGDNNNPGSFLVINRALAQKTYGTIYVIPTEDEWYKAAFFKTDGSGYALYANGTSIKPVACMNANYSCGTIPWKIGSGTMEQNGTFDMMGNLWEWNESLLYNYGRGLRGDSIFNDGSWLASSGRNYALANNDDASIGFRVAIVSSDPNVEVLTINSGVDAVTFIHASWGGGGFDHVFTAMDFTAAQNGLSAHIVPSENTGSPWTPNGSTYPAALWINSSVTNWPSASTLYAVPFTLTRTANVKLDFYYAIDDSLGDPLNSGLFINGTAVSGTNSASQLECSFVHGLSVDITEYINRGLNYLYIYQCDQGGWSGSQFTAVITATSQDIPESPVAVTVGVHPNTLNLMSKGNWISCIIEFPTDVNVTDVNSSSILLNGQITADSTEIDEHKNMVVAKFNRTAVGAILDEGTVELTVSGTLNNSKQFEGKDTITVIKKPYCLSSPAMDFNGDCKVDIKDYALFVQSWLNCNLEPKEACGQ